MKTPHYLAVTALSLGIALSPVTASPVELLPPVAQPGLRACSPRTQPAH